MDADEIDALNVPGLANLEQLKLLNMKVEELNEQMAEIHSVLTTIANNTRPSPTSGMGSSYKR